MAAPIQSFFLSVDKANGNRFQEAVSVWLSAPGEVCTRTVAEGKDQEFSGRRVDDAGAVPGKHLCSGGGTYLQL